MQKFGNDRAGAMATRVAYQALFSIFPLLLLLTTILGFLLDGRPQLRADILDSALADIPIIGTQLQATAQPLQGNGFALAVGIAGTIYGGLGVGQATQEAMNSVWNVPYVNWPSFVLRKLRALAVIAVIGLALVVSGALSVVASRLADEPLSSLAYAGSVAITLAMFLGLFMLLTAEPLTWRDVMLGAVLATIFWHALQLVASWYVSSTIQRANDTYGFFAVVIALLSFMYVAAQLTLLAAEINVVRKYRLWPRSMTQPPLTDGDQRTFSRLASMAVRRPEYDVRTVILSAAHEDPLADEEAGASGDHGARGSDDSLDPGSESA